MTSAPKKATAPKRTADESEGPARKGYKVLASLIQVPVGDRVLQYSDGDFLPSGVDEDSIKHLLDLGFVAEV